MVAPAALGARGGAADALAHDVITRLAKLRSLFVIAQGTVFALHERRIGRKWTLEDFDKDLPSLLVSPLDIESWVGAEAT